MSRLFYTLLEFHLQVTFDFVHHITCTNVWTASITISKTIRGSSRNGLRSSAVGEKRSRSENCSEFQCLSRIFLVEFTRGRKFLPRVGVSFSSLRRNSVRVTVTLWSGEGRRALLSHRIRLLATLRYVVISALVICGGVSCSGTFCGVAAKSVEDLLQFFCLDVTRFSFFFVKATKCFYFPYVRLLSTHCSLFLNSEKT